MSDDQPELFDEDAAKQAGDEAVDQVGNNADPKWIAQALDAVRRVASEHASFTTDDVWRILLRFDADPRERRAMGHVMRKAAELGICEASDDYRPSVRPACHGRPVRVWHSLDSGAWNTARVKSAGGA